MLAKYKFGPFMHFGSKLGIGLLLMQLLLKVKLSQEKHTY
jgi:hypothetical protein